MVPLNASPKRVLALARQSMNRSSCNVNYSCGGTVSLFSRHWVKIRNFKDLVLVLYPPTFFSPSSPLVRSWGKFKSFSPRRNITRLLLLFSKELKKREVIYHHCLKAALIWFGVMVTSGVACWVLSLFDLTESGTSLKGAFLRRIEWSFSTWKSLSISLYRHI